MFDAKSLLDRVLGSDIGRQAAGLGAEEKAFVFDLLARPISLEEVARTAMTEEQSAELYLAARLVIEPDQPAEKAFLEGLAARLKLPAGLAAHLDTQVVSATVKA